MNTSYPSFGRHLPEGIPARSWWGARAIFTDGNVDIVHDRQQFLIDPDQGFTEEAAEPLRIWLNSKGLPLIKAQAGLRFFFYPGSQDIEVADDGDFHIEASPQGSYGYLFIGAWQIEGDDDDATE